MVRRLKRRVRRRYKGGSVPEDEVTAIGAPGAQYASHVGNMLLDRAKDWIQGHRDRKTISHYFQSRNHNKLAKIARFFGFGKRPRRTIRRRIRRRGGMIAPLANGFFANYHPIKLQGGKRKRYVRRKVRKVGGRRRTHTTRRRRGTGFLSSLWDGAKSVFNTAKDIALPVLTPIAQTWVKSQFNGGRKRRTYRKARRVGGRRVKARRTGRGLFGLPNFSKDSVRNRTNKLVGIADSLSNAWNKYRSGGTRRKTRKIRRVKRTKLAGRGRKRTTRRSTRRRGRGFLTSMLSQFLPI